MFVYITGSDRIEGVGHEVKADIENGFGKWTVKLKVVILPPRGGRATPTISASFDHGPSRFHR